MSSALKRQLNSLDEDSLKKLYEQSVQDSMDILSGKKVLIPPTVVVRGGIQTVRAPNLTSGIKIPTRDKGPI
ncbi:MAG: hypothetical protein QM808_17805 [Steroidobacteraceae bacterium]